MGKVTRDLIKHESLFVVIPAGFTGGQINFPDDQYIRNKKLMALEVIPSISEGGIGIPQMLYPDNHLIADRFLLTNCYITMESYAGVQFVRKKPVLSFMNFEGVGINASFFGVSTPPNFIGQRVNWPKSFIEFPTMVATAVEQYALFDVFFTELKKETIQKQLGVGFQQKK